MQPTNLTTYVLHTAYGITSREPWQLDLCLRTQHTCEVDILRCFPANITYGIDSGNADRDRTHGVLQGSVAAQVSAWLATLIWKTVPWSTGSSVNSVP